MLVQEHTLEMKKDQEISFKKIDLLNKIEKEEQIDIKYKTNYFTRLKPIITTINSKHNSTSSTGWSIIHKTDESKQEGRYYLK